MSLTPSTGFPLQRNAYRRYWSTVVLISYTRAGLAAAVAALRLHHWTVGDMVIWDNACVMHRVEHNPVDSGRLLSRTTLVGGESLI
jgi:alpha-ketoglutarate-dependent taurine dioxygenase